MAANLEKSKPDQALYVGMECPTRTTVFNGSLRIHGWIALDVISDQLNILDPQFAIEIESKDLDFNLSRQVEGSFLRMAVGAQHESLLLKELCIVDRREIKLVNGNQRRLWYSVKGELLHKIQNSSKSYNLRIRSEYEDLISYSHKGSITFSNLQSDILCGTEQVLSSELYDEILLSNFWFVSQKSSKIRGKLDLNFVNGSTARYSELTLSGSSPDLANIWPSCPNSNNARASALLVLPEEGGYFSYSYELILDTSRDQNQGEKVFIGNSKYSPKVEEARIDFIGVNQDLIFVEGILWSERPFTPNIFIASSHEYKCLTTKNSESQCNVEWFSLPSDCATLGSRAWRPNNRFKLSFPADILGESPGQIKLWYSLNGQSFTAFSDKFTSALNIFVNDGLSEIYNDSSNKRQKFVRKLARSRIIKSRNLSIEKLSSDEAYKPVEGKIITHFHNLSATEGAPRVLYNIVNRCLPRSTLCISTRDGDLGKYLTQVGNELILKPKANIVGLTDSSYQSAFLDYLKVFRTHKPQLLIANSIDSFLAVDVAWRIGLPAIWIIHESIMPSASYLTYDLWIRERYIKSLLKCDRVVFVSHETRQMYKGLVQEERAVVINNGLDFEFFNTELSKYDRLEERTSLREENFEIKERDIVFLSVGTTTERKGQDRTLREIKLFADKRPDLDWKLLIIGGREIPYLDHLNSLITEYKLNKRVLIVPETKNVHKFYALSDYFILNSREESSPLVILEAMAASLPIFSTDVYGLKEILTHKKNAMIFNGEAVGELSNLIVDTLANPQILQLIKNRAFEDVQKNHSLDNSMSEYWKLISDYVKTSKNN